MERIGSESVSGASEREARADLGRRIARLRRARGWSRGELAERLGVSRERLGNWERGVNTPPLKGLVALREVLGVSIDELVTGEPAAEAWLSPEERQELARHLDAVERLLESWEMKGLIGQGDAQGGRP